jgi:predicted acyltransferase
MKNFDSSKRLVSLDMLRGLTIALMIVVNDPGSWDHLYWPLAHASWNGITITDFVFPFFIFIVGVSIVLSSSKQLDAGADKKKMIRKIWIRSLKIFALGLLLALFPEFNFMELRIPGVLQRIAICYLVCAHIFLATNWKTQVKMAAILLIGYWLAMMLIPVPGIGAGVLEPGKNLAAWIDSVVIPLRMYRGTWDPEGVLSTLPAIATGITGMLAGHLLKADLDIEKKLNYLFFIGLLCVVGGYTWDLFFPFNKNLWSSSYVLFTSGWAFMAFAACILLVDVHGYDKMAKFGIIYGSNAITIYVFAGMFPVLLNQVLGVKGIFFNGLVDLGMAPKLASMLWAFTYMFICFIPAYILYKKKIFIKV